MTTTHVVALSGGKDSTALALRLAEVEPRAYVYLCTPTGDELPAMQEHWRNLEGWLNASLTRLSPMTLAECIERNGALPNFRMRFCTRQLKILPCLDYLRTHAPCVLYVGLRADEEERRGLYDADTDIRFPLREWGWGVEDVRRYLRAMNVRVPRRTDCARCPFQRLSEWRDLLREHPDAYADAETMEARFGATFRSPGRDTKPTALADLRRFFEQQPSLALDLDDEYDDTDAACRVCRM